MKRKYNGKYLIISLILTLVLLFHTSAAAADLSSEISAEASSVLYADAIGLTLSVSVPTKLDFYLDPNGLTENGTLFSPAYSISNYSNVDIELSISDLAYTFSGNGTFLSLDTQPDKSIERPEKAAFMLIRRISEAELAEEDGLFGNTPEQLRNRRSDDYVVTDQIREDSLSIYLKAANYDENGEFVSLNEESSYHFAIMGDVSQGTSAPWQGGNIHLRMVYRWMPVITAEYLNGWTAPKAPNELQSIDDLEGLEDALRPVTDPEASATPQPSPEPNASATPQPSVRPDSSATPQPSAKPNSSATPQPSATPSGSVTPQPSGEPSGSAAPQPSSEPNSSTAPQPSTAPDSSSPQPSAPTAADTDKPAQAAPKPTESPVVTSTLPTTPSAPTASESPVVTSTLPTTPAASEPPVVTTLPTTPDTGSK